MAKTKIVYVVLVILLVSSILIWSTWLTEPNQPDNIVGEATRGSDLKRDLKTGTKACFERNNAITLTIEKNEEIIFSQTKENSCYGNIALSYYCKDNWLGWNQETCEFGCKDGECFEQSGWSWKKDSDKYKLSLSRTTELIASGEKVEEDGKLTLVLDEGCVNGVGKFLAEATWTNGEERTLRFEPTWYMTGAGEIGTGINKMQLIATDGFIPAWELPDFENKCNDWVFEIMRGGDTTPTTIKYNVWFYPS